MEKYQECLELAKKHFKVADHMAYVTFTLLKENRLMIKVLVELSEAVNHLIRSFIHYEYAFKRITLYKDPRMNLKTFIGKIAPRYLEKDEIKTLIKILDINKKHKQAPVEFVKKDKFVILLGDEYVTLTIDKIKEYIYSVRKSLSKFPEQN